MGVRSDPLGWQLQLDDGLLVGESMVNQLNLPRERVQNFLKSLICFHWGLTLRAGIYSQNQDYLVPYRTAFLLYIAVRDAVTRTAFTMETMICKVFCDNPIRQRLKAASVYSGATEFGCGVGCGIVPGHLNNLACE